MTSATRLGETLEQRELDRLLRASYDLVVAKLPKSRRPGQPAAARKAGLKKAPS